MIATAIGLCGFSLWVLFGPKGLVDASLLAKAILSWVNVSLALTLGVLGFLITGFAIFASISNADLFIALASSKYEDLPINKLQFVLFNFLRTFFVYIGLLCFSIFIELGYGPYGPLQLLGYLILDRWPYLAVPFNLIALSTLGFWIVVALIELKSFIWNLYQTVLLTVVAEHQRRLNKTNN